MCCICIFQIAIQICMCITSFIYLFVFLFLWRLNQTDLQRTACLFCKGFRSFISSISIITGFENNDYF